MVRLVGPRRRDPLPDQDPESKTASEVLGRSLLILAVQHGRERRKTLHIIGRVLGLGHGDRDGHAIAQDPADHQRLVLGGVEETRLNPHMATGELA